MHGGGVSILMQKKNILRASASVSLQTRSSQGTYFPTTQQSFSEWTSPNEYYMSNIHLVTVQTWVINHTNIIY